MTSSRFSKAIATLLALVMIFGLAACSGGNERTGKRAERQAKTLFASLGSNYEIELPVLAMTGWSATFGTETTYSDFSVDEQGRIVKYTMQINGESYDVGWKYDSKGRVSRDEMEYIYDDNDNLVKKGTQEFLYDKHGLVVEEKVEGETEDIYRNKLDDAGRVRYVEDVTADRSFKITYEYTYDELGLPVSYIESKYGSAVYEDIDTLSEKFNITCEINPLGFLVKEEQRRIYDSSQRQNEDYDTTATCDVVGTYRVLSSDDSRLQSGASFVGFEEYAAFPKPDSVNSDITFLDKIGNDYRFRLGDASLDPIATYHTLTNVFTLLMPSRSFCPESNNLYFSYAGVLKLLGYQTTINTDGQIDVTDADGIPVAVITKAAEGDMYVMHVTLAETGA